MTRAERALRREGADVQLVEHESRRATASATIDRSTGTPTDRRPGMGHAPRRGWKRDAGSGNDLVIVAVEAIAVERARRHIGERPGPVAARLGRERTILGPLRRRPRRQCRSWRGSLQPPLDDDIDGCVLGSPDAEGGRAGVVAGAQKRSPFRHADESEDAAARSAECGPSRADCSARSRARTSPCRARTPAAGRPDRRRLTAGMARSRVDRQIGAQERGADPRFPEVRPRRQPLDILGPRLRWRRRGPSSAA